MTRRQVTTQFTAQQRTLASKNPVRFLEQRLGVSPWKKQREILEALADNDYVAVRSCNGAGKTYTAALATIWWLLAHDKAIVVTTAPTDRQVRELLWREIRAIHRENSEIIGGRISQTKLEIAEQHYAFGFSTNTDIRFQGFHHEHILIVVDEASGVRPEIFEAIQGSMTSGDAKVLMIGNPTSLDGVFYDAFHKNRERWTTIHISAFDTPNFNNSPSSNERDAGKRSDHAGDARGGAAVGLLTLAGEMPSAKGVLSEGGATTSTRAQNYLFPSIITPEWAENVAKDWGTESPAYQIRVLGEFPSNAPDTLIPLIHIEAAVNRQIDGIEQHPIIMGIDIARFGDDKSVACVRQGPTVLHLAVLPRGDTMQTTGHAIEIAKRHSVKTIYVDEIGIGAGVLDRMREIREIHAEGVNVGHKAYNSERFVNRRAEAFDALRDRFNNNEISIPDDPKLISQLASLKYLYTSRGQLQLQDKQSLRNTNQPSPDKADALMLAFTPEDPNPLQMWIL